MTTFEPATATPGRTRVGWVGTGVMGLPMARRALVAGYALSVFNRTTAKTRSLVEIGATVADTPRQVAEASDIVFTIVGHPRDVREVFLGPDGFLAADRAGLILVDHTTSEPELAEEIAARAAEKGHLSLDAPVSGGDVGANAGTLSVMVGGDESALRAARPVIDCYAKTVVLQGPPGAGQRTKVVNQILIASTMVAVCEGLLFARRSGLDPETALRSVSGGAAGSKALEVLGPRILKGDYAPGFFVEHFLKDMGIALAECRRLGLTLPGLELAQTLYAELERMGHGKSGTQALALALDAINPSKGG